MLVQRQISWLGWWLKWGPPTCSLVSPAIIQSTLMSAVSASCGARGTRASTPALQPSVTMADCGSTCKPGSSARTGGAPWTSYAAATAIAPTQRELRDFAGIVDPPSLGRGAKVAPACPRSHQNDGLDRGPVAIGRTGLRPSRSGKCRWQRFAHCCAIASHECTTSCTCIGFTMGSTGARVDS